MQKFAVCIVKGNNQKVVSTHIKKEEALLNGDSVNKQLPKDAGVVSCIFGEFDENNQLIGKKSVIHKVWL